MLMMVVDYYLHFLRAVHVTIKDYYSFLCPKLLKVEGDAYCFQLVHSSICPSLTPCYQDIL